MTTTLDTVNRLIEGNGSVGQKLLQADFNVNALRTNDVLRKEDWVLFDNKVIEVARKRLVAVGDLMSQGLSMALPNALGVTQIQWETVTDLQDAIISMSGISQGGADRPEYALNYLPVPITHKDFTISARNLAASRKHGTPLDVTQVGLATRIVAEKIETTLFNGSNVAQSANKIYGYTTHPNRNTGSVTASWVTATGTQILTDVLAMMGALANDNMYGPYMIYVPVAVYTHMGDDLKANSDKSIIERIKSIPGIIDIKPSKDLTGTNVIMVQMTDDVVDIIDGIQPTMVMWESNGGMLFHFKVLGIIVPRIKVDATNQCGIAHYS